MEENSSIKKVQVTEFPETIDLTSNLDSVYISNPLFKVRNMITTEDHLISMNSEEPLFSVYNNLTVQYIGSFGFAGEGPLDLEFNSPNASSFKSYKENFLITDRSRIRVLSIDKKSDSQLLRDDDVKVLDSKKTTKENGFFNNAFLVNDNMIFTTNFSTKKHFQYINLNTGEIGDSIDFPDFHPEIPVEAYHHLYTSHTATSLDKGKFVIAYQRFPLLRVYDLNKSVYTEVSVKPENDQIKDVKADARGVSIQSRGMFIYYQSVVISENYIYAKYQEGSFPESGRGEVKLIEHTPLQIHVFGWDGKPVKKLLLPEWANRFTVTPNDEFIYFFHPENENYLYRKSMKD